MPIYEYRCERGHTFEVLQRMTEDPLTVCEEHGTPVHRVFHPVAVHFKGSGFYNTDYGKKKKAGASSDGKGDSDSSSTSTTGGDYKKKDAGSGSKDSGSSSSSTATGSSSSSE